AAAPPVAFRNCRRVVRAFFLEFMTNGSSFQSSPARVPAKRVAPGGGAPTVGGSGAGATNRWVDIQDNDESGPDSSLRGKDRGNHHRGDEGRDGPAGGRLRRAAGEGSDRREGRREHHRCDRSLAIPDARRAGGA